MYWQVREWSWAELYLHDDVELITILKHLHDTHDLLHI